MDSTTKLPLKVNAGFFLRMAELYEVIFTYRIFVFDLRLRSACVT